MSTLSLSASLLEHCQCSPREDVFLIFAIGSVRGNTVPRDSIECWPIYITLLADWKQYQTEGKPGCSQPSRHCNFESSNWFVPKILNCGGSHFEWQNASVGFQDHWQRPGLNYQRSEACGSQEGIRSRGGNARSKCSQRLLDKVGRLWAGWVARGCQQRTE